MIVVGLTGSIGMGKSVLARQLRSMKIPVHASDEAVHKLLGHNGLAVNKVGKLFPKALQNNRIDRKILGQIVFDDAVARKKLEKILHPLVRKESEKFLRQQRQKGRKLVVLDIPLLFETNQASRFDHIIVVTAPQFVQKRRVLSRRNMTEQRLRAILKLQMPDREKRARADSVINTAHGYRATRAAVKRVISALKAEGEKRNGTDRT